MFVGRCEKLEISRNDHDLEVELEIPRKFELDPGVERDV